jgi:hypothetical protein
MTDELRPRACIAGCDDRKDRQHEKKCDFHGFFREKQTAGKNGRGHYPSVTTTSKDVTYQS